jgi:hypothetical protein
LTKIKSQSEVKEFLEEINNRLNESSSNLRIIKRTKSKDKTQDFMIEYGLNSELICKELLNLDITNYSYTDEDRDTNRLGEVWIFGQIFITDKRIPLKVYIKLKLNSRVICLSFHEQEYELKYPYL